MARAPKSTVWRPPRNWTGPASMGSPGPQLHPCQLCPALPQPSSPGAPPRPTPAPPPSPESPPHPGLSHTSAPDSLPCSSHLRPSLLPAAHFLILLQVSLQAAGLEAPSGLIFQAPQSVEAPILSPSREGEQGNAPLFLRACLHEYGKTYTLEIRGFSVCGQDVTKASLRFHLSEVSGVSGRSLSCLVAASWPSQSAHDSFCLQEGRTCFICKRYLLAGFPGSAARSACQAAKLHLLVPSTATVPAHHPSKRVSWHCVLDFLPASCLSLDCDLTQAPPDHGEPTPPGPDPVGLSCLSMVPLLVGPNHESMEDDGPLIWWALRSFQSGSVRGEVIFSCSLWSLLGCKSPSLLGDGFLCCGLRHHGVPVPAT